MFFKDVNSDIYVDKTLLIEQSNKYINTNSQYVCISRPRRFGKSMAANMLTAYYSRGCDSKEMFSNLKIAKADSFEKHLNKYNVISFDMQKFLVKTENVKEMLELMEQKILKDIRKEFSGIIDDEEDLMSTLEIAFAETGIPFVFIIDEQDCVLRYYKDNESAQKTYLDYLYALFKGQPYVALAYMTGILPIKKYNPRTVTEACRRKRFTDYWSKTETYIALKTPINLNFDGLVTSLYP